jgi:hypothetical protein
MYFFKNTLVIVDWLLLDWYDLYVISKKYFLKRAGYEA